MAADGSTIYVGGSFGTVNGLTVRNGIAAPLRQELPRPGIRTATAR
jgi:hypothetical protein